MKKEEVKKERERHVSLSDAVLQEYEEVLKENKRLHNVVTELHKKHHDVSLKVENICYTSVRSATVSPPFYGRRKLYRSVCRSFMSQWQLFIKFLL